MSTKLRRWPAYLVWAAIISLVVLVSCAWLISYLAPSAVVRDTGDGSHAMLLKAGRAYFISLDATRPQDSAAPVGAPAEPEWSLYPISEVEHLLFYNYLAPDDPHTFGFASTGSAPIAPYPMRAWMAPLWFPSAIVGAIVVMLLIRRLRRSRHRTTGLCTACGYDLRATLERCPECGHAFQIPAPPV